MRLALKLPEADIVESMMNEQHNKRLEKLLRERAKLDEQIAELQGKGASASWEEPLSEGAELVAEEPEPEAEEEEPEEADLDEEEESDPDPEPVPIRHARPVFDEEDEEDGDTPDELDFDPDARRELIRERADKVKRPEDIFSF